MAKKTLQVEVSNATINANTNIKNRINVNG